MTNPTDGSPAGPGAQPGSVPVRRMSGLATPVIVVSVLLTLAAWAEALLTFPARTSLAGAVSRGQDLQTLILPVDVAQSVKGLLLIPAWVLTAIWLGRGHRAARAAAPDRVRRATFWSWLSWVAPVLMWWFPKQVVDDTWDVAADRSGSGPKQDTRWWWGFWLGWIIMTNLSGVTTVGKAGERSYDPTLAAVNAVVLSIALVFWVRVVRGLSAAHDGTAS